MKSRNRIPEAIHEDAVSPADAADTAGLIPLPPHGVLACSNPPQRQAAALCSAAGYQGSCNVNIILTVRV